MERVLEIHPKDVLNNISYKSVFTDGVNKDSLELALSIMKFRLIDSSNKAALLKWKLDMYLQTGNILVNSSNTTAKINWREID